MLGRQRSALVFSSRLVTTALLVLSLLGVAPIAAAAEPSGAPGLPVGELVERRTANSRTVRRSDGKLTTTVFSAPVHFNTSDGWREIDSKVVEDAKAGYAFRNAANGFGVAFKDTVVDGHVRFDVDGSPFVMTLEGARAARAQTKGPQVSYPGVAPGVDLVYDVGTEGVKETLVLHSPASKRAFSFRLQGPPGVPLAAHPRSDGAVDVWVEGRRGSVFQLAAPVATEADGAGHAIPGDAPHASMAVTNEGPDLRIDLAVDEAWASHPSRRYPLLLDPTVTIQPSAEDASFQGNCPTCVATTGTNLYIGTNSTQTWRSAAKFDLSAVPAGAAVSDAKLNLYYGTTCVPNSPAYCGGVSHTLNAHRITGAWTTASTTSQVTYDAAVLSNFVLPGGYTNTWMTWGITQTVKDWLAGAQANNGVLIKRDVEDLNKGGPAPAGKRYTADASLRPKLDVTYTSDASDLLEPDTLHANGAELRWSKFVSQGGSVFSKYEVHRAAGTAAFTPSASTLLTTISDPSVTSYVDTTAKPATAFTYRIVTNTSPSNPRTVTLPAAGQSKKILQPLQAEAKQTDVSQFSNTTSCSNYGADYRMFVGPSGGALSRALVAFDLRGVPATATVNSATMSLWHVDTAASAMTIRAHRVTRDWDEGTGSSTCTGDGATWYDAQSGGRWAANGGDFDGTALATVTKAAGDTPRWDAYSLTGQVQSWVNGTNPNLGVMLKADDETISSSKYLYYYSDDVQSSPTLRPKLEVLYTDGTQSQGPVVTVGGVAAGSTVSGTVALSANASDDRRVDQVEFLVDGVVKATDTTAPYTYSWGSTTATNAAHTITARATDDVANTTTSVGVTVTVDNTSLPAASVAAPTGTPYATAVQADAPRGWWRLGEAAGATTAADASGNNLAGTYRNTAPGQPGALANDNNGGARFPATAEDYDVNVADNALLDFGTGDFTAEAWVKTALNQERTIMAKSDNVAANWRVTVSDDTGQVGHVRAQLHNGTSATTAYGPAIRVDDGQWHHVVAVYQRSYGIRVYVDGIEKATAGATATTNVSNAAALRIGDTAGYAPLNGDIDEAAVYPVALSATRVAAHYDAAVLKGTTTLAANASDDQGVARVEFYVDGNRVAETATSPYTASWNTQDPVLGAYDGDREVTTKTYSTGGQVTTSAVARKKVGNVGATKYRGTFATTAIPLAVVYDPAATTQDKAGVDVTVTNTGPTTWSATDVYLHARWIAPDGTTSDGPATSLGTNVAANTSKTVRMLVDPPVLAEGVDQALYRLRFDLKEASTASWFAAKGNAPSENPVTARKAARPALGLERWQHYEGEELGGGMQHLTNVASGNSIWRWTPFSAPGRGLATVVDLTYNSLEQHSDSPAGNNVSLSISGLTRLGSRLDVHPNNADTIAGRANRWIAFTDGDGTAHRFEGTQAADGSIYWEEPAGVHLYLREFSTTDTTKKWALTRPDRVTFFFDVDGYPTGVEDANANRLNFTLSAVDPGDDPGGPKKRVTRVTDAAGLGTTPAADRAFNITYYTKADAKKPQIRGKVKRLSDHTGSALDFEYYDDGNLRRLIQRGGTSTDGLTVADRAFVFTYTTSAGDTAAIGDPALRADPDPKTPNQSTRLYSIRDARGKETVFTYHGPTSGQLRWRLASRADRKANTTTYAYDLANRLTTVTAPLSRVSKYAWDGEGKVTGITNPKNETTTVAWTGDRHVQKVTEPTGKYSEFAYNDNGYLTDTWNQLRQRTSLEYQNVAVDANDVTGEWKAGRTVPHISQLAKKTEPKGTATATPTNDFQWSFSYDATGNLRTITDPQGFVTDHTYNPDGTRATTTDARGVLTTTPTDDYQTVYNTYDANGLVTKVTDANDNVTQFTYDADGLLTGVQDAAHATDSGANVAEYRSRFYYDPFHRLTRQSTPKSTSTDRTRLIWSGADYDANDNVTVQVGPHYATQWTGTGAKTTMSYDDMDRPSLITGPDTSVDPAGERVELAYDAAGRVTRQTEPKGMATTATADDFATFIAYDPLDRVTRQTRHEVNGTTIAKTFNTHLCYDVAGDLRSTTAPKADLTSVDCASTTTPFTTRYDYDDAHRPLAETDALGRRSSRTYDANGNVETTTDENGNVTTVTYDERDQPTKIVEPFVTTTPVRSLTTKVDYDPVGNTKRLISPRAWDASADKATFADYVTSYSYDELSQLTRVELPKAGTEYQLYVHTQYDRLGRVTASSLPDRQADPNLVGASQKTMVEYFDPGWVRTSDDTTKPKVAFDYTAEGWQSLRTPHDEAGAAVPGKGIAWAYFADGMLRQRQDEADQTQVATYAYDANNNLTSATDAAGVVGATTPVDVSATYDGLNRIVKVRQKKKAEANYRFTTYAYDLNSNVADREDDGEETPAGSLVKGGRKHHFDYDGADWLTTHLDYGTNATSAADDQRITNQFAPTGWETERKVEANNGSGVWSLRQLTNWTHFANGKLKTLTTMNGANAVVESHTVGYDDPNGRYVNGNRTSDAFTMVGPDTAAPCRTSTCTTAFTYDARERLTTQELKNSSGTVINSTAYVLDDAGNIAEERFARGGTTTTRTMTYGGDRLNTVAEGGVTQNHFYDPDGNLDCITTAVGTKSDCNTATGLAVSAKLLSDYGYDYLNRLQSYQSFTTDGTTSTKDDTAAYTYDALDRTIEETESHGTAQAKTTLFAYLGLTDQQVEEQHKNASTGALITTKTVSHDAFGNRTAMTTSPAGGTATTDTFGYDVHGSVSLLIGAAGTARAAYGYKPYGEADPDLTKGDLNNDDPVNPFRYTAKRFDSGSGSLDMGARRFGPSTARFLQGDKYNDALDDLGLGFDPLTQNRYSLAGGNPINFVEVDGHRVIPDGNGTGSRGPTPKQDAAVRKATSAKKPRQTAGGFFKGLGGRAKETGIGLIQGLIFVQALQGHGTSADQRAALRTAFEMGKAQASDPVGHVKGLVGGAVKPYSDAGGKGEWDEVAGTATFDVLTFWATKGAGGVGRAKPHVAPNTAGSGPVTFRPPPGATADEIAQVRAYVDGCNAALCAGQLSPTGRVSTSGALRADASRAAAAERARAAAAGSPYSGHAGHVPDTTWTGSATPPSWMDLTPRVNTSLGGQSVHYPVGYRPTVFEFLDDL